MLILTRKIQESVVVGGSNCFQRILKVKVLEIRGEKVKLGFDVDPEVPVHRLEVWERIFGEERLDNPNQDAVAPVT
jgi:carbon storage regulator